MRALYVQLLKVALKFLNARLKWRLRGERFMMRALT